MTDNPKVVRLQRFYESNVADTVANLDADPRTARTIQRMRLALKYSGSTASPETIVSRAVTNVFRELTDGDARASSLSLVLIEDEYPDAVTVRLPNHDRFIRVSTALLSIISELSAVLGDIGKRRPKRTPETQLAALRYFAIQRTFNGVSGRIPRRQLSPNTSSSLLMTAAIGFVLAHEINHHFLDHEYPPSDITSAYRQEYEADLAGVGLARDRIPTLGKDTIVNGAVIALLAMHFIESAEFVVRPPYHPTSTDRTRLLTSQWPPSTLANINDLTDLVVTAANLTCCLREQTWGALYANRAWDTSVHGKHVYQEVSYLDKLCGMQSWKLDEFLKASISASDQRTLNSRQVCSDVIANLTEWSNGLSMREIVVEVDQAPAIQAVTEPYRYGISRALAVLTRNTILTKAAQFK